MIKFDTHIISSIRSTPSPQAFLILPNSSTNSWTSVVNVRLKMILFDLITNKCIYKFSFSHIYSLKLLTRVSMSARAVREAFVAMFGGDPANWGFFFGDDWAEPELSEPEFVIMLIFKIFSDILPYISHDFTLMILYFYLSKQTLSCHTIDIVAIVKALLTVTLLTVTLCLNILFIKIKTSLMTILNSDESIFFTMNETINSKIVTNKMWNSKTIV